MIITNHSAMLDILAERVVKECVGAYEVIYGKPSSDVEIILCSSEEDMEAECLRIQGKDDFNILPSKGHSHKSLQQILRQHICNATVHNPSW